MKMLVSRFVSFDPLGHKLITGIANRWIPPSQWDQQSTSTFYSGPSTSTTSTGGRDFQQRVSEIEMMQERLSSLATRRSMTSTSSSATSGNSATTSSWEWTTPFSNLLQEYESLVQRCRQRLGTPADSSSSSPNRVNRGTNTQDIGVNATPQLNESSFTQTSTTAETSTRRYNTFMQCIASFDEVATTNIERLRNPLAQGDAGSPRPQSTSNTSTSTSQTPSSFSNVTIPCSVNLGERVSEEGLRRLRELWRAGNRDSPSTSSTSTATSTATSAASASTSTRNTTTDSSSSRITTPLRIRRRRRLMTPFEPKRETKRLRCDYPKKDPNSPKCEKNAPESSKNSSTSSRSSVPESSTSAPATSQASTSSSSSAGTSRASSSIYDDPQPSTSNARDPEVILILSDSDSSSDSEMTTNRSTPAPVIDLTSSERPDIASYRARLERRIHLMQMLNSSSVPRTPSSLQTSQQSAFRPQAPRSSGATNVSTSTTSSQQRASVPRFLRASADLGVRYAIRMLSRHIDLMERRCRARLEILQLEQIRRLWEEFMTQLSSLNSTLSNNSSRRESIADDLASSRDEEVLWTRRPGSDDLQPVPGTSQSASTSQSRSRIDREAATALEDAYNRITEGPPLEDVVLMFDPPSTNNLPSTSNTPSSSPPVILRPATEMNQRVSMSGQVPEDSLLDDSTRDFSRERSTLNSRAAVDSEESESRSSLHNLRVRLPAPQPGRGNDSSEEYHITLLRANQISVLRRLLSLLDRNDIPLQALSSRRNGPLRSSNSDNTESTQNSQQPRTETTDRNSPTEFLEELRSIQQSIVERYDHMSLEIPSQEAMQRDLDRIVNLEAAVRERLRLSEDNYERSLLETPSNIPPRLGSPWSRDMPSRNRLRRVDPFDPTLLYWGPDASNPRDPPEDNVNSTNSFHSRLTQPFLFRPPPEPMLDERPESQRDSEASEEWQQNASLLQTTRRQAWRVLGLMVRHVRQHIELHQLERFSEGSALQAHLQQLLSLLHRALELTDTLLTQMLATRREMETQWRQRLRPSMVDRSSRYRHMWYPPLQSTRISFTTNSVTNLSPSVIARAESLSPGIYEMHRRGLSDTDPAIVNHLIQHFQRRTPEQSPQSSSSQGSAATQETRPESDTANDTDRSEQLRQRLGGLWSCRRGPPTESSTRSTQNLPSTSGLNSRATTSVADSAPRVPQQQTPLRVPTVSPADSEIPRPPPLPNESPSIYDSIRSRYNRVCTILDRLTRIDPSPQFRSWADNLRRLLEMPQRYFEAEDERQRNERRQSAISIPTVRVNDVPVSDPSVLSQQNRATSQPTSPPLWTRRRVGGEDLAQQLSRPPSPVYGRVRTGAWRSWMYYPRNRGMPTSARDLFGASHQATMEGVRGAATSCPTTLTHRIQCWPFMDGNVLPDISNPQQYLVVANCRINNDASVAISRDGRLLVALVPSPRPGGHSKLGEFQF
ncbi:hypothetical protein B566_EDAN001229 [Ephemera danica]|nr:hypothetical protein B566_EDAN001229 [Ephemera danica]